MSKLIYGSGFYGSSWCQLLIVRKVETVDPAVSACMNGQTLPFCCNNPFRVNILTLIYDQCLSYSRVGHRENRYKFFTGNILSLK